MFHRQVHLAADAPGDDVIVPGKNLHIHMQGVQVLDGFGCGGFRRVQETFVVKRGDKINVGLAKEKALFVRFKKYSLWNLLREKLGWN